MALEFFQSSLPFTFVDEEGDVMRSIILKSKYFLWLQTIKNLIYSEKH
ncbi:hypothetical protein CLV73_0433 [Chryseobacterium geocarposphaerae]|uniref:Uncharacterized protein n=1 Tax=Chryseobacterium geocarposphaerae TaxID=1416776 RepID=A0A2M9C6F0_9FLAO|nr:hypothetical protein CLV73_0404 [Chryseobacterium geocarposphaerae]PJJ66449.1 hypothetical protein CLV73_0433 [Chryseobacterium geocarposphaerae]